MNRVVILVHGTDLSPAKPNPGPRWSDETERFAQTMRTALSGKTRVLEFPWNGANSHAERHRAARNLAAGLDIIAQKLAGLPIYIVGHSHGGNVALYALRYAKQARLSGIATLGTPFVSWQPRPSWPAPAILRWIILPALLIGCAAALFAFLLMGLLALAIPPELAPGLTISGITLFVASLVYVAPDVTLETLLRPWTLPDQCLKFVESFQRKRICSYTGPRKIDAPTLRLLARRDEVLICLQFSKRLADLPFVITMGSKIRFALNNVAIVMLIFVLFWDHLNSGFNLFLNQLIASWNRPESVEVAMRGGGVLLIPTLSRAAVIADTLVDSGLRIAFAAFVVVAAYAVMGTLQLMSATACALFPRVVRAHRWCFGGESVLDNVFMDIRVEPLPPNAAEVLAPPLPPLPRLSVWRHCDYMQPACAEMIGSWINDLERRRAAGSRS